LIDYEQKAVSAPCRGIEEGKVYRSDGQYGGRTQDLGVISTTL
jgi:hypothetical protein